MIIQLVKDVKEDLDPESNTVRTYEFIYVYVLYVLYVCMYLDNLNEFPYIKIY